MGNPYDILQSTADLRETIQRNLDSFGSSQRQVLSSTEELANGWFERRHAGIQSALTAAQSMCAAETPMNAISEYQKWASGAAGRIIADGLAYQKYLMTVAGLVAGPLSSSLMEGDPAAPYLGARQRPSKAA